MNIKRIFNIIPLIFIFGIIQSYAMEIILQGEINETYDDNIYSSSTNPEDDWITNIMLGFTARSERRELDLDITGHINQQISTESSSNNSNSQDITLSFNKDFTENVSLRIVDIFEHYPEAGSFGVLFGRGEDNTGYISNAFSVNLSLYITAKSMLYGMYSNSILNNDSNLLSDSVMNSGGGGIAYNFNTANVVRLGYVYQLMKYDSNEKIRSDSGYAEYEKYFTKQLHSVIQGGYDYIDSYEGQSINKRWQVSLIDNVDENNQLNVSYNRGSIISNVMNDILDNWRISGNLIRQISDRTVINMSIFYGEGTYKISGIKDKLFGGSVNFAFIVTEFVNFNTQYVFTWYNSKVPGFEETAYNRNQFSVGISAVY